MTVLGTVLDVCVVICEINCVGVHEAGNDHSIRFHKVEPMCAEWAVHGQPTALDSPLLYF